MRKLPHGLFVAGYQLPGAIRDARGRVLIPAGITLSDDHLRLLGQRALFGGDDWPATTADAANADDSSPHVGQSASGVRFTLRRGSSLAAGRTAVADGALGPAQPALAPTAGAFGGAGAALVAQAPGAAGIPSGAIALSTLRVGTTTTRDLFSPSGVLLLSAGTQITARFLELLTAHGVRWVQFSPTPAAASPAPARGPDGKLALASLAVEVRSGLESHAKTATHLRGVCQELATGRSPSGKVLTESVRGFLDQLALDRDILALVVSMQRTPGNEYLFDHCLNTSLTSLSIAAQMGLPPGDTFQLGLAALLHDIGMLHVPDPIRLAARTVTPAELAEIRRHPIVSSGRIERITHLPDDVAAVAGQIHEREDGSGYPRGRTSSGIHPLAKIVAVADSFCAMTRARPHRSGLPRHAAMRTLLGEGHAGRLDRGALRGLLDAVSAYPIGCVVELSDARKAQVLRPNRGAHTRPVLRVLGADNAPTNELIDLAADRGTTVASISDPGCGA